MDLSQQLAEGFKLHQAGRLAEAEQLYLAVLSQVPNEWQALHLLGVVEHQTGRHAAAIDHLHAALRTQPRNSGILNHLGAACGAAGRLVEAESAFRTAVALTPLEAQTHYNLAALLGMRGRKEEAIAEYRETLRLNANFPEALFNLGNSLSDLERNEEAIDSYQRAIALRPGYVLAYNNLGNVYNTQGRLDEAVQCFQQALKIKPDNVRSLNNLGVAMVEQGKFAESEQYYSEALRLKPNFAEAINNLGVWHYKQGHMDEAIVNFNRAIAQDAGYAEAHKNRAAAWLMQGDYERGWPEYEWRWKCKDSPPHGYPQPLWDGSPLAGRTILLYAEQGLGDTLQFVRYAPLIQARGGRVIMRSSKSLVPLLRSAPGIDDFCPSGEPLPAIDVQAPLLTLPALLGTAWNTIPADVPYLFAQPQLIEKWRERLANIAGYRIGINWQGRPRSATYRGDVQRAIPLAEFGPLTELPGVQLFSLQFGPGSEQIAEVAGRFKVHELGDDVDREAGAFMDTAAVMRVLDLVITSDTATAHLAGALGVPTWLVLPSAPDWRWRLTGDTTPWYPTMRLFRQQDWGVWSPVFSEIREALRQQIG